MRLSADRSERCLTSEDEERSRDGPLGGRWSDEDRRREDDEEFVETSRGGGIIPPRAPTSRADVEDDAEPLRTIVRCCC